LLFNNLLYCSLELYIFFFFFFQAEDGIRGAQESRGLGDVYKKQLDDIKISEKSKLEVKIKNSNFKLKFGEKVKKYFKGEL